VTDDEREELAAYLQKIFIKDRPTYRGDAQIAGPASDLAWQAVEALEPVLADRERALRSRLAEDIMRLPLPGEAAVLRLAANIVLGKYRVR